MAKGAVASHLGTVRLLPVTDSEATFVEWGSTYESDDERAVGAFCDPIYQALLQALKRHFM